MSQAAAEAVARAVASELSSAGLGFSVSYQINPDLDLKDLKDATLATVRDVDDQMTIASRSMSQHDYLIEVCLRRRVNADDDELCSTLKYALQTIAEYYRFRAIASRAETLNRVEQRQILVDKALQNRRVMKATVILVFRGWRS